jgi:AcrR family transcriptional regulator
VRHPKAERTLRNPATPRLAAPRGRGRPRKTGLTEQRQDEILDAAIPLFARYGYRTTDLDQVAAVVGVGKGTVYRYFPSKRELFLRAVDRGMRRLHEQVDAACAVSADPFAHMELSIRAYLTFFDRNPEVVELLIQERAEFKDRKRQTYFEHTKLHQEQWKVRQRALVAEGRVRDLPFKQIADFFGYVIYGAMFTNYFKGREKSIAEQTREILDILWLGTLSNTERSRRLPAASSAGRS